MFYTKTIEVTLEKAGKTEKGTPIFTGYASKFGNIDSYGDMVKPGAFAKTLAEKYPNGGSGIPVYWNHETGDPFSNLGLTIEAKEDEAGLRVKAPLDISHEKGARVAKLLDEKRVTQMSFKYSIKSAGWEVEDGKDYYALKELDLHEVSIVPFGANPETEIIGLEKSQAAPGALKKEAPEGQDVLSVVLSKLDLVLAGQKSIQDALVKLEEPEVKAEASEEAEDKYEDSDGQSAARREMAARKFALLQLTLEDEGEK